jgi:peptidyl-prolyl cis-trans isomerase B (cyclophilin B)
MCYTTLRLASLLRKMLPSLPRLMASERLLRYRRILLVCALVWFAVGGDCDAAVREYAFISIKIGTSASTPENTGTLVFELWPDLAPKTVQNFKHLANTGFYDETASHRLIKNFMIQAGDPYTRSAANVKRFGTGGPGYTIPDELAKESDHTWEKRKHVRGVLSMAHSNNPAIFNTGGSQFFVMFGTAEHLDGVHTTFGTLVSGSEFLGRLMEQEVSGRDTSYFDLINPNGIFEAAEKQLIIQACRGTEENWGPIWRSLLGKRDSENFTPNEYAFIQSKISAFIDTNGNSDLDDSDLAHSVNSPPLYQSDQPIERIGIQSVRVFAIDDAIQDGATVPFSYESTTHSGLLRPPDRSEIMGRYNVSVQRSGAFSAVVEYLARRISFSGKFVTSDETLPDSNVPRRRARMEQLTVLSDSVSAFPLLVELRLHNTYSSGSLKNSIGVTVASIQLPDVVTPLVRGFSESLSLTSRTGLSTQYTMLTQPIQPYRVLADTTSSVSGNSHFLIQVNPSIALSLISGRLSDGVPFTTSRVVGNEHGATILPIYTCTFPSGIENQRSDFPSLNFSTLYVLTYGYSRSLAFGSVQIGEKSRTEAPLGDLIWLHPETTFASAPLKNRLVVNNVTATTPWTAPTTNAVMKPFFTLPPRGQLLVNGNTLNFTVNNNIIATFQQPTSTLNPFLRFDPRTGEFSGYFFETTPSVKRRVFSGVLLNSTNANGGFGYYLDANSSKSVRIIPITP